MNGVTGCTGQWQVVWTTRSTYCRHSTSDDHTIRVLHTGQWHVKQLTLKFIWICLRLR